MKISQTSSLSFYLQEMKFDWDIGLPISPVGYTTLSKLVN